MMEKALLFLARGCGKTTKEYEVIDRVIEKMGSCVYVVLDIKEKRSADEKLKGKNVFVVTHHQALMTSIIQTGNVIISHRTLEKFAWEHINLLKKTARNKRMLKEIIWSIVNED